MAEDGGRLCQRGGSSNASAGFGAVVAAGGGALAEDGAREGPPKLAPEGSEGVREHATSAGSAKQAAARQREVLFMGDHTYRLAPEP
jgi:hypothetical protein